MEDDYYASILLYTYVLLVFRHNFGLVRTGLHKTSFVAPPALTEARSSRNPVPQSSDMRVSENRGTVLEVRLGIVFYLGYKRGTPKFGQAYMSRRAMCLMHMPIENCFGLRTLASAPLRIEGAVLLGRGNGGDRFVTFLS